MGDRLLRAVEKWLLPWYDRDREEESGRQAAAAKETERRKAHRSSRLQREAIAARQESEQVRRAYQAMADRLARSR